MYSIWKKDDTQDERDGDAHLRGRKKTHEGNHSRMGPSSSLMETILLQSEEDWKSRRVFTKRKQSVCPRFGIVPFYVCSCSQDQNFAMSARVPKLCRPSSEQQKHQIILFLH